MIFTPSNSYYLKYSGVPELKLSSYVEPQFVQDEDFSIIYRVGSEEVTDQVTGQATDQVREQEYNREDSDEIRTKYGVSSDEIRSKFGVSSDEIRSKFGVNVLKTVVLIGQNPAITAKTIALELGLNSRTIENYLAKLKEQGYIERVGSDKTGTWKIVKRAQ